MGEGSPLSPGDLFSFNWGVSSPYSGASLLGAGVRLEVESGTLGSALLEGTRANPLGGKTESVAPFLWKKLAIEDWFLLD